MLLQGFMPISDVYLWAKHKHSATPMYIYIKNIIVRNINIRTCEKSELVEAERHSLRIFYSDNILIDLVLFLSLNHLI